MTDDRRFTNGLIYDVVKVLEAHGYATPDDDGHRALGHTVAELWRLCETFEGRPLTEDGDQP